MDTNTPSIKLERINDENSSTEPNPAVNNPNSAASNDVLVDENLENDSVRVSIEPNHESEIYEIRPDGTEVYKE